MLDCKLFSLRQLPDLQPLRLPQFDPLLDLKDGLAAAVPHVNMYGPVFVAVKEESVNL